MACVTIEDFIKPRTRWTSGKYRYVSQILVVCYGLSYILVAYLASVVGGLIRVTTV